MQDDQRAKQPVQSSDADARQYNADLHATDKGVEKCLANREGSSALSSLGVPIATPAPSQPAMIQVNSCLPYVGACLALPSRDFHFTWLTALLPCKHRPLPWICGLPSITRLTSQTLHGVQTCGCYRRMHRACGCCHSGFLCTVGCIQSLGC